MALSRIPPSRRDPAHVVGRLASAVQRMAPGNPGGRVVNASPVIPLGYSRVLLPPPATGAAIVAAALYQDSRASWTSTSGDRINLDTLNTDEQGNAATYFGIGGSGQILTLVDGYYAVSGWVSCTGTDGTYVAAEIDGDLYNSPSAFWVMNSSFGTWPTCASEPFQSWAGDQVFFKLWSSADVTVTTGQLRIVKFA